MKRTILFILTCAVSASATTIMVPQQQPTMQAAVNIAGAGDTILVDRRTSDGPGNYDVDLQGKALTIRGVRPDTYIYTADSLGVLHHAFLCTSGEDSLTRIENFKFRSGDSTGAILVQNASPVIRECEFLNLFGLKNAVHIADSGQPRFVECTFSRYPGSVFHVDGPTAGITVDSCIISENQGPAAVTVAGSPGATISLHFLRSLFVTNFGSCLQVHAVSDLLVSNCTFIENFGDGILLGLPGQVGSGTAVIENTLVVSNGGRGIVRYLDFASHTIACTDVWDNDAGDFVNVSAAAGDAQGNLSVDPGLFPSYEIPKYVPSIPALSICDPANNSCGVIIGAYAPSSESSPCCVGETGDVTGDGNKTISDLALLVNSLFVTFQPLPCRPEANTDGDPNCLIRLTDLTKLLNSLFVTFYPLAQCSSFDASACE